MPHDFQRAIYGMGTWSDLFTPRQTFAITHHCACEFAMPEEYGHESEGRLRGAVQTCLALTVDK